MSSDINAVVESLILVFNEWHKLHIKLFSLCSGPSEQSTCEAVSQYTLFSKFPTPSCLNPACSYLILQTVSGLNRFHNCDVTKKGWFNDMTMMTLSSRFKLTNVDSMKWRWWRCSWSRFKLTNEPEQLTWRVKKKKKVNNNHCGNYHYGSASRTIKSDRADPTFETTLNYFLRAHRSFSGMIGLNSYHSVYRNLPTLFQDWKQTARQTNEKTCLRNVYLAVKS